MVGIWTGILWYVAHNIFTLSKSSLQVLMFLYIMHVQVVVPEIRDDWLNDHLIYAQLMFNLQVHAIF